MKVHDFTLARWACELGLIGYLALVALVTYIVVTR